MNTKARTTAFLGLCTALMLILAYVEMLLPPIFASVPGIKMGLPNIIIILLLYRKGPLCAAVVSLLRIVLVAILFGNAMAFLYSLAGGILSLAVMILLSRLNLLSTVGVSVAGGVAHNVGQIIMAVFLLETTQIVYYLAVLMVTGVIAGVVIGLCGAILVKRIPAKFTK